MLKKITIIILLFTAFYIGALNNNGRVICKLYEGWSDRNDIYIIALNGYYMPLIADDLETNDIILYTSINCATYLYSMEN